LMMLTLGDDIGIRLQPWTGYWTLLWDRRSRSFWSYAGKPPSSSPSSAANTTSFISTPSTIERGWVRRIIWKCKPFGDTFASYRRRRSLGTTINARGYWSVG
jgi:hypothetical protein